MNPQETKGNPQPNDVAPDDESDDDEMFGGGDIDESLLFFNEQMGTMNGGI